MKNASVTLRNAIRSHGNHNSKAGFVTAFILFFLVSQALMAAGTITGTVYDAGTGETLPAANVVIEGTSLGSAADLDGVYSIPRAPAGRQTLVVTYIGYEPQRVEVTVPDGGEVEQDVRLEAVAVRGETVVVTGQAMGQIEAINKQLASNTITNVVSKSKIHELPDDDAATALSRLPGLSIQQGDKVVIRGVEARMNLVLVNGIQLPSTDMQDRSTNLGFISSNMLDGIEVTKVVTPDMDANAIGGVVNLRLREAPSGVHLDVLTQGTYNSQDRTLPGENYKVWASISNRFFNDKLGVFVQANANRSDGGADQASAAYGRMGVGADLPYGEATYGMNSFVYADEVNIINNTGGSLILDYKLPEGKIVMQNTFALTQNDMTRHREFLRIPDRRRFTVTRDIHEKILMINALQTEYSFGNLDIDLGLSHSYSDKKTDLRYGDPSETEYGFVNQTSPDPALVHNEAERLQLTPEDVYQWELDPNNWIGATILQDGVTRDEAFDEHLYNAKLDLSMPFAITEDISVNLKFGGKIKHSVRNNDIEATHARLTEPITSNIGAAEFMESIGADPTVELQFSDFYDSDYENERGKYYQIGDFDMANVINTDRMDEYFRLAPSGWPLDRFVSGSTQDDYNGIETFSAGYLMGEVNIGSRLTVLGGVRYEKYDMDYDANFVYITHPEDGVAILFDTLNTVTRTDDDLFPNLQIRYKATKWFDVRAAYSKTISRPSYNSILPNPTIRDANYATSGNPYLKPAIADNLDLYFSFYNNHIGLFTMGGFYKEINNIFFQEALLYRTLDNRHGVVFPDSLTLVNLGLATMSPSAQITTFINNPNAAHVRGLEFDWQTTFWYLPKPLNAMVLNINYTRVWSDMDYRQVLIKSERIKDGKKIKTVYSEVDTVRNARLLYQGDHVINIALGADYKGFSGRISFNLQGDVITTVAARPEEDAFTGNVYKWDFSLQQKLPVKGLSIALSGINIFNNAIENYQRFRRSPGGEITDNLTRIQYNPRRFEFGLRYTL